ncbi:MAG: hypothetical protein EZS28_008717 [Streblomastix strix]|uniref:Uncharacterized protein n=1 Tax=Streblomastix strix TaxID=222440 RepID=A0A5J4WLK6_9EUKA|nr:MAG: hypothetical protein EZS28_008717 [Streblomastix strix]
MSNPTATGQQIDSQQYIWAGPLSTNSATLFVTIIFTPNDFYNQGSIHQCYAQMMWIILFKCLLLNQGSIRQCDTQMM